MAESCISVCQNQFSCPVCLDLLEDPVTIPCGHSYCKVCINATWDRVPFWGSFKCPECRAAVCSRPALHKAIMLAEVLDKLKKTELQAASSAHCYAGPGDVECDFCTGRKCKAVKSCLVCLASYCEDHLQPHYQSPAFKRHELVEACTDLQEMICSEHNKLMEIYCRTDQSLICYLCMMEKHKGHDTVKVERTEKQAATDDRGKIFTELISSIRQEIADLKKRVTELKKPSHTDDHLHLLQSFPSLCVSPGCDDSPSFTLNLSSDGVRKYFSDLKKRVEEIFEELNQIYPQGAGLQMILLSEEKSREEFLQYFCYLTLEPNTAHPTLVLTERNRAVTGSNQNQLYSDHPDRFDSCSQVLCKESVCGYCYWEVKWSGDVEIAVSYKHISRKGWHDECLFGFNTQSWSLRCSSSSVSFWHNVVQTKLSGPPLSRIGVYVDHNAGTLSFYSISDSLRLFHRVHTTFIQPLYVGFRIRSHGSTLQLL